MAYWLGMLFADGNVFPLYSKSSQTYKISLGLKCSDYHHVLKFKSAVQSSYPLGFFRPTGFASQFCCARHQIHSEAMGSDLIALGCVPEKSLVLDWPTHLPDQYSRHFLRGYFDGDGCICYNISSRTITVKFCGSYQFIPKVQAYIKTNVISASRFNGYVQSNRSGTCYSLFYGGTTTPTAILDWLYQDSDVSTRLERKYQYNLKWKEVMDLRIDARDFEMKTYFQSDDHKILLQCKQCDICPRNKDHSNTAENA